MCFNSHLFVYSMVVWRKEWCTHPSRPRTSWSSLPRGAAQNLLRIKDNAGGASVVNRPGMSHVEASLPGCTQIPDTRWHLCAQFRKGKAVGWWAAGKAELLSGVFPDPSTVGCRWLSLLSPVFSTSIIVQPIHNQSHLLIAQRAVNKFHTRAWGRTARAVGESTQGTSHSRKSHTEIFLL